MANEETKGLENPNIEYRGSKLDSLPATITHAELKADCGRRWEQKGGEFVPNTDQSSIEPSPQMTNDPEGQIAMPQVGQRSEIGRSTTAEVTKSVRLPSLGEDELIPQEGVNPPNEEGAMNRGQSPHTTTGTTSMDWDRPR
jgi:hypothetical protein